MQEKDDRRQMHSYQLVVTVVMKNCDPLVSGPAFAIDSTPVYIYVKQITMIYNLIEHD